ncbi:triose-phosphate isomerase [Treponema pectinovorum]|uniref:triose-phosphate isomerase n=1 Tax=Treponema pectinovorum TaxID=164 RepID=UPI0011C98114|nr:triose-phosphate isomerase [Treponema pectinovorum]
MRSTYIAGNWKMNMEKQSSINLVKELVSSLGDCKNKVMIAPPFVYLDAISSLVKGTNILLGAQNCAATDNGAHTGEISVNMLKDLGVQVVILGHSERRYEFGECDELINMKVLRALASGLDVIICIGELLAQREVGRAEKVCERQLNSALLGVSKEQLSHVTIAYEPVWAIGTGKTATPNDAQQIHNYARKVIAKMYDKEASENIIIQYGGSMNVKNYKDLLAQEDVDGGLIGGAALKAETFIPICNG